MTLDLSSARDKLQRALLHVNEMGDHMGAVEDVGSRYITQADEERHPDPAGVRHFFRVGHMVRPLPDVATVVGDYIQNIRSALDHLAWEMVLRGSTPEATTDKPTAIQFPIYTIGRTGRTGRDKPKTFTIDGPKNLPGISRDQLAFVRRYQPYHRGNWHLSALANLSNNDKHRVITPVDLFAAEITAHDLEATVGSIHSWRRLVEPGSSVDEGTPFLEVVVDPEAEVIMHTTLHSQVAFQERPGRFHKPVNLVEIGSKVAEILREAAQRWGVESDATFFAAWEWTARFVMAQSLPANSRIERLTKRIEESMGGQLYPGYLSLFREAETP